MFAGLCFRPFPLACLCAFMWLWQPAAMPAVDFEKDILPVLEARCMNCHGPDSRKGGLRLDSRKDALLGGDEGAVIVPGNAEESRLFQRITQSDPSKRMPRDGKPLSAKEIADIEAWIQSGALWPTSASKTNAAVSSHWAFQAIRTFSVPSLNGSAGPVRHPIDAFVFERLTREGIKPSPEADRHTLIRRLSLDLLGLPPTPQQVEAFVQDNRPDAYERLVEQLLASPHFGERWARHWLDMARYADSDGYEKDRPRPYAYLYRDWVIRAINDDMPFDQFSTEQIAGDLLPHPTHDQLVATGFHRQTLTNTEGGVDQEEFRCKATVDRVNTTATVWLGVTMGCAECHSHKYDPFTQREYYQLFAFFNDASEKNLPSPQPDELAQHRAAQSKWAKERERLTGSYEAYLNAELPAKFDRWLSQASAASTSWTPLKPIKLVSANGATLSAGKNHVVHSTGKLPDTDIYTVEVEVAPGQVTGFRLEALDDPDPKRGPGRAKDGNFVLTGFKVQVLEGDETEGNFVELANPQASHSQAKFPVANALKSGNTSGWAVAPKVNESHTAVFETKDALRLENGMRVVFHLEHCYRASFLLQRFRLSATASAPPLRLEQIPEQVTSAMAKTADQRTAAELDVLKRHFTEQVDPEARKLKAAIDEHGKKEPKGPETFAATMVAHPNGRTTHVHVRGNFMDRGAEVQPSTPSVLHTMQPRGGKPDRLDLARWLFDPANPLTARVTANHFWKNLFGRGLVATVDDFGARGEKPSHPELLDWLAAQLPKLGWSRKELIKLIVTSATYKQSSITRAELEAMDPANVLLARQNRLRMEAETVRDAFLAASGLLSPAIGGPSVKPALPPDIAALGYANSVKWTESSGSDKYRRGLYIFFQRTVPFPMLMTFDAPDSNATCTRRERSNTPLQALTLLNDPAFFECSQALGDMLSELTVKVDAERIQHGFLRCMARLPSPEEISRLEQAHRAHVKFFRDAPEKAAELCGAKDASDSIIQRAAWAATARVMLNLDEFITRN